LVAGDCNAPNALKVPFRLELVQPVENSTLPRAVTAGLPRISELSQDVLGEELGDFPMPGHRLRAASSGVAIPVVIPAMPDQDASGIL